MKQPLLALLVALALALAGCGGNGGDDSGTTPTPPPSPPSPSPPPGPGTPPAPPAPPAEIVLLTNFSFTQCAGIRVLQPTAPDDVAALLPDGFTPATQAVAGVGPDQAVLGVDLYECGSFQAGQSQFQDVWFGHAFTYVEAPTERYPDRTLDADHHEYLFQTIAGEDILAQLWPVAGYNAHNGSTSLTVVPTPLLGVVTASAGDYSLNVQGAPAPSGMDGSFLRYTVLEDGTSLLWRGQEDLSPTHMGIGSAAVPGGSPFAGLGPLDGGNTLRGESFLTAQAGFTEQHLVRVAAPTAVQ